jgi:hypothetical protein
MQKGFNDRWLLRSEKGKTVLTNLSSINNDAIAPNPQGFLFFSKRRKPCGFDTKTG